MVIDDPTGSCHLGEIDLHLINEGRHENLWEVLGARVRHYKGLGGSASPHVVRGLGAPRGGAAEGRLQQLGRPRAPDAPARTSGVWELFVPGRRLGAQYKFAVLGADGQWREKADPMAFHTESPAGDVVGVFESATRGRRRLDGPPRDGAAGDEPMSVYEMHLGVVDAAGRGATPRSPTSSCRTADLGFTHVEFLP
jgi:1,4-alpha-glucan branching enzyme